MGSPESEGIYLGNWAREDLIFQEGFVPRPRDPAARMSAVVPGHPNFIPNPGIVKLRGTDWIPPSQPVVENQATEGEIARDSSPGTFFRNYLLGE